MSTGAYSGENTKQLLNRWTESLVQVLESMTDQRPEVVWTPVTGPLADLAGNQELLWWEQPFPAAGDANVWVGAPRATWEYAGTLTLKAAGLETVELNEARNTWLEILGQSLAAMGRSIGSILGREVNAEGGAERPADASLREWASVSMTFPGSSEATPPLLVACSQGLIAVVSAPPPAGPAALAAERAAESAASGPPPTASRTMDLLLDVDLPVSISFGKARLPMKDVLKLTTGSIVELDRGVNDPVEVLVNHCLIARGEVVVVEGNYGVRIQEIASRQARLRSLR